MHIMVVNSRCGVSHSASISLLSVVVYAFLFFASAIGVGAYIGSNYFAKAQQLITVDNWRIQQTLDKKAQEVDHAKDEARKQLDAFASHLAKLQSHIIRIDALGERLTNLARLDTSEFDFNGNVGQGGTEHSTDEHPFEKPLFLDVLDRLSAELNSREKRLEYFEKLLGEKRLDEAAYIAGFPVRHGYRSSGFGVRVHPITGKISSHTGIDFAAREGTDILSTAEGVVVYSGVKGGYGNRVEVSHRDGYKTTYSHNSVNLVRVGDLVKRGQVIARVGSTGASTGYHLHFEVEKDGKLENPDYYIARARNFDADTAEAPVENLKQIR